MNRIYRNKNHNELMISLTQPVYKVPELKVSAVIGLINFNFLSSSYEYESFKKDI